MPLPQATQRAPTQAELEAQLTNLQRNFSNRYGGGTGPSTGQYNQDYADFVRQQLALSNRLGAMQGNRSNDPIEAARTEAFGLARGAVNTKNPLDESILRALQERSGANAGPFDEATRNALMTQAAESAAQVARNQTGRIAGNAGDPSVMAANNEAEARRLAAIQQAQLGINTQANVANYDARGQALGQFGAYNQAVQGQQRNAERYLIDMLRAEQDTQQMAPPAYAGIPTYTQYSQAIQQPQYQPYRAPAPQVQQAPATQIQQAPTQQARPVSAGSGQSSGDIVLGGYRGLNPYTGLPMYSGATQNPAPAQRIVAPTNTQTYQRTAGPATAPTVQQQYTPWNAQNLAAQLPWNVANLQRTPPVSTTVIRPTGQIPGAPRY